MNVRAGVCMDKLVHGGVVRLGDFNKTVLCFYQTSSVAWSGHFDVMRDFQRITLTQFRPKQYRTELFIIIGQN